ncbi:methionine adenosyltransferase, partial [bacterium]|nr:methionine adenosyltransferase [bacterium]
VLVSIHEQSPDIAMGVDEGKKHAIGAGDQGMMSGFACTETKEFMPLPIMMAQRLAKQLSEVRKRKIIPYLRPDGKTQVTIEYKDGKPYRAEAIVVAIQHDPVNLAKLRKEVTKRVVLPVCKKWMDKKTKVYINHTGRFVIGGPVADAGMTGRKIICDTYGGVGNHGGGAFSGKDPTKVDRSATYAARHIAKNVVAAKLADECLIQISYAIGIPEPVSIYVNTNGTGKIPNTELASIIKKEIDLTPKGIIHRLNLRRPIYRKTAAYGHFGRNDKDFTWENLDIKDLLLKSVK